MDTQNAALAAEYDRYVKNEVRARRAPLDPDAWIESRENQRRGTERAFGVAESVKPTSEPERAAPPSPAFAVFMLSNGIRDDIGTWDRARHYLALGAEPDAYAGGDGKLPPPCPLCGGPVCPWAGTATGGAL